MNQEQDCASWSWGGWRREDSEEGIPGSACWEGQGLQVNKGGHLHLLPQGQAQECLLEKSMLDNRKSFLVARISAQVGMG